MRLADEYVAFYAGWAAEVMLRCDPFCHSDLYQMIFDDITCDFTLLSDLLRDRPELGGPMKGLTSGDNSEEYLEEEVGAEDFVIWNLYDIISEKIALREMDGVTGRMRFVVRVESSGIEIKGPLLEEQLNDYTAFA